MSEIAEALKHSAKLIKLCGKSRLSNGLTLSEMLTVNGIPFWDSFTVELARLHVPAALSPNASPPNIIHRIRPYLSQVKQKVKGFFSYQKNQEGCSIWPSEPVFLILGFGEYFYKDVLQPVVALLVEHQNCHIVVLNDTSWPNMGQFVNQNVTFQTIWQHWDAQVGQQASELKQALCRIENELLELNILSQIMGNPDNRRLKNFKNIFNWFFRVYLPLFVPKAVVAQHILETHHPNIVISPDVADPRTRIYSLLGRKVGIPCIEVQFGLILDEGIEWQFLEADRVAVWGDTSKEIMLTHHSVPAEQIVVTGSPRYDCQFSLPKKEVYKKCAQLGVHDENIILLASAYDMKDYKGYYTPNILQLLKRDIFKAADKTPGICLVVKPHPLEDVRETRKLAGACKNIIFVDQNSDIQDWINICDVFMSFGSTATIDALIAGKLTICPVYPGFVSNYLFRDSGATLAPESLEEIINIFKKVAKGSHDNALKRLDPARLDFLKQRVGLIDGKASARIEALALNMAGIGCEYE